MPLSSILDFLASEYAEGKQYRTLNSYHSAISMTHSPIDGVVVGKHPLVVRVILALSFSYNSDLTSGLADPCKIMN